MPGEKRNVDSLGSIKVLGNPVSLSIEADIPDESNRENYSVRNNYIYPFVTEGQDVYVKIEGEIKKADNSKYWSEELLKIKAISSKNINDYVVGLEKYNNIKLDVSFDENSGLFITNLITENQKVSDYLTNTSDVSADYGLIFGEQDWSNTMWAGGNSFFYDKDNDKLLCYKTNWNKCDAFEDGISTIYMDGEKLFENLKKYNNKYSSDFTLKFKIEGCENGWFKLPQLKSEVKIFEESLNNEPDLTLPPSKGTNPFAGKNFSLGSNDVQFSEDIITFSYNNVKQAEYKYTVNAETKTLSWQYNKLPNVSGTELLSVDEYISYLKSGDFKKDMIELRKKGIQNYPYPDGSKPTQEEIDKQIKAISDLYDILMNDDYIEFQKTHFLAVQKFDYTYNNSELKLISQFNKNCADFSGNACDVRVLGSKGAAELSISEAGSEEAKYFSGICIDGNVTFYNVYNTAEKFNATYVINAAEKKLKLYYKYNGKSYTNTLSWQPSNFQLSEK